MGFFENLVNTVMQNGEQITFAVVAFVLIFVFAFIILRVLNLFSTSSQRQFQNQSAEREGDNSVIDRLFVVLGNFETIKDSFATVVQISQQTLLSYSKLNSEIGEIGVRVVRIDKQADRLQLLLEQHRTAIVITDLDGYIIWVNSEVHHLLKVAPFRGKENPLFQEVFTLYDVGDNELLGFKHPLARAKEEKEAIWDEVVRVNGYYFRLQVQPQLVQNIIQSFVLSFRPAESTGASITSTQVMQEVKREQ